MTRGTAYLYACSPSVSLSEFENMIQIICVVELEVINNNSLENKVVWTSIDY